MRSPIGTKGPPGMSSGWRLAGEGTTGTVPTFTLEPFDGAGAELCPCSIVTSTPQAFVVTSWPAT